MSLTRRHANLLIDDEPLQLLPDLAVAVGLNEAVVLQQVHYWMSPKRGSGKVVDGRRWVYNTYKQWQDQFPFWTQKQIGNAVRSLEKQGLLESRQDLNESGSNRSKWYSVNYDHPVLNGGQCPDSDIDDPYRDVQRPIWDVDDADLGRSTYTETTQRLPESASGDATTGTMPRKPEPVTGGGPDSEGEPPKRNNPIGDFLDVYVEETGKPQPRGKAWTGHAKWMIDNGITLAVWRVACREVARKMRATGNTFDFAKIRYKIEEYRDHPDAVANQMVVGERKPGVRVSPDGVQLTCHVWRDHGERLQDGARYDEWDDPLGYWIAESTTPSASTEEMYRLHEETDLFADADQLRAIHEDGADPFTVIRPAQAEALNALVARRRDGRITYLRAHNVEPRLPLPPAVRSRG